MWQVHRIQNMLLWEAFAEKYARLKRRWSHEPDLDLVNGGAMTLWHGTTGTQPIKIYATEHGKHISFLSIPYFAKSPICFCISDLYVSLVPPGCAAHSSWDK